jgi:hypothetical protein
MHRPFSRSVERASRRRGVPGYNPRVERGRSSTASRFIRAAVSVGDSRVRHPRVRRDALRASELRGHSEIHRRRSPSRQSVARRARIGVFLFVRALSDAVGRRVGQMGKPLGRRDRRSAGGRHDGGVRDEPDRGAAARLARRQRYRRRGRLRGDDRRRGALVPAERTRTEPDRARRRRRRARREHGVLSAAGDVDLCRLGMASRARSS